MSKTVIAVTGEHEIKLPPERATVSLQVEFEGTNRERVIDRCTKTTALLREKIETVYEPDAGPITWWSAEQLRTWTFRPWSKGKRQPAELHAEAPFSVKFSDFAVLSEWITVVSELDGVEIKKITWTLTEEHEKAIIDDVRRAAVQAAAAKAAVYAEALDLSIVEVLDVADHGLLPNLSTFAYPVALGGHPRAGAGEHKEDFVFKPSDITVDALVEARFSATKNA